MSPGSAIWPHDQGAPMSGQPCPGKCNSRYHRVQREYRQALAAYDPLDPHTSRPAEPGIPVRAWGEPVWCADCATEISKHLASLYDLACLYAMADDGHHTAPVTQRVGGTSVALSPSEIHDQLEELTSVLSGWEMAYRRHRELPDPPPRGEDATVQATIIAWLSRNLPGILASPLAEEIGRGILTWRATIANKAAAGTRTIHLPTRCPGGGNRTCGQRLLFWEEGSNRVECKNPDCRRIIGKDEYDLEVERQLQAHRDMFHRGRECNCATTRTVALFAPVNFTG
jgi:hypothetical protein